MKEEDSDPIVKEFIWLITSLIINSKKEQ